MGQCTIEKKKNVDFHFPNGIYFLWKEYLTMKAFVLVLILLMVAGCVAEASETTSDNDEIAVLPESNTSNKTTSEPEPIAKTNNTTEVITSETEFPKEPVFDLNYTDGNGTLRVFFFHSPGCSACQDSYPIIEELEGKHPEVDFINYSLATQNGSKAYVKFAELHNLSTKKQMVPQVLVNGTIITDRFNIEEKLGPLLQNLTE
jgi:thiol-disulfide isomerase/thioredoxin